MHLGAKIVCVIKKAVEKSIAFLFGCLSNSVDKKV